MKKLLATLICIALTGVATAAQLTLKWNPNPPEEAVTRYEVTYSTPGPDGLVWQTLNVTAAEVGGLVPTRLIIPNLQEGATYTFLVRAANQYGVSEPSDPLSYTLPKRPAKPGGLEITDVLISSHQARPAAAPRIKNLPVRTAPSALAHRSKSDP